MTFSKLLLVSEYLASWIHLNIILFIAEPLPAVMAFLVFRRNHYNKRIIIIYAGLLLLGA